MTEPIPPEEAEDGYYWSTALEDVIHVDRDDDFWEHPDRAAWSFGTEMPSRLDKMDGVLIPLDLPPEGVEYGS